MPEQFNPIMQSGRPGLRLADIQVGLLSGLSTDMMPSGTEIDYYLLKLYLRKAADVAIFGVGTGERYQNLINQGYEVTGYDINSQAVEQANDNGIPSVVADLGANWHGGSHQGVILEGLLCSACRQTESDKNPLDQLNLFLRSASRALVPNGFLFIADMLSFEDRNPVLLGELGYNKMTDLTKQWLQIYKSCMEIGLPALHYLVLSPDTSNRSDVYKNPARLKQLYESGQFERIARHMHLDTFTGLLEVYEFACLNFSYHVWHTRSGKPLSGFSGVWQKRG